jgi:hypothetical protein
MHWNAILDIIINLYIFPFAIEYRERWAHDGIKHLRTWTRWNYTVEMTKKVRRIVTKSFWNFN